MKYDLKQAFGVVIKELREANSVSQQELADFSEVDRSYISDLERGLYYPTLNTVYKLAEVLKIKPSKLIERVDAVLKG